MEGSGFKKPLIYAATETNVDEFGALAKEHGLPLVVKADSVEGLIPLIEQLTANGLKDLMTRCGVEGYQTVA